MPKTKTNGARIKERRQALGLSSRRLGEMADVHYTTILGIEREGGGKLISAIVAYRLAKALQWRIEDILGVPKLYYPFDPDEPENEPEG